MDRSALLVAARKKLSEVYAQRPKQMPMLVDDEAPNVDAFMAAVRLGDTALVYALNGPALQRKRYASTWQGEAPGWVVITARTAWVTTDGALIDGLYDKHMELELAKVRR